MKSNNIEAIEDESRAVTCSVWGLNDCGQLLNNEERIIKRPKILQSDKGIFGFVSGDFHTLLITDSLKLYSAGMNIYGQLGISSSSLKDQNTHQLQDVIVFPPKIC
jgi:alpha-tubulin suppressor-like RCC1 family protein